MDHQAKPLIVGESNPYSDDPKYAMYPAPSRSAGYRLCVYVLGMKMRDYLAAFDRVDLCSGKWSLRAARERTRDFRGRNCILLGSKVATAFDVPFEPFASQFLDEPEGRGSLLVLPHPSGLCRLWHEPGAYERARKSVGEFAPEIKHLLGWRPIHA